MAAREIEVLLEVGGFVVDGGVEMIIIQVHIDVQKLTLKEEVCQENLSDSGY